MRSVLFNEEGEPFNIANYVNESDVIGTVIPAELSHLTDDELLSRLQWVNGDILVRPPKPSLYHIWVNGEWIENVSDAVRKALLQLDSLIESSRSQPTGRDTAYAQKVQEATQDPNLPSPLLEAEAGIRQITLDELKGQVLQRHKEEVELIKKTELLRIKYKLAIEKALTLYEIEQSLENLKTDLIQIT